jgi:hypothetical protein
VETLSVQQQEHYVKKLEFNIKVDNGNGDKEITFLIGFDERIKMIDIYKQWQI